MEVRLERERMAGNQRMRLQRKRRRRRAKMIRLLVICAVILMLVMLIGGIVWLVLFFSKSKEAVSIRSGIENIVEEAVGRRNKEWEPFYAVDLPRPPLQVDLLTVNDYSRPGETLPEVKNIFVHYTANAGTSAAQNRSYFEGLKDTGERSASAHFVIGYEGEMIQCIPTSEIAYAVMKRNYESISIECCYLDENGQFTEQTYDSLIQMTAWLLHKYQLAPEDVLRHYDAGGKNCPKYFVEQAGEWERFQEDLKIYMKSFMDE